MSERDVEDDIWFLGLGIIVGVNFGALGGLWRLGAVLLAFVLIVAYGWMAWRSL